MTRREIAVEEIVEQLERWEAHLRDLISVCKDSFTRTDLAVLGFLIHQHAHPRSDRLRRSA